MLEEADARDGPPHHVDLRAVLPSTGGVAVHLDSLVPDADTWWLHLRAEPRCN
jgi:hypothetical protein